MTPRVVCAVAALMLACGGEPAGPPTVAYGLEECDHCRMIISEQAHAAAVVGAEGGILAFDDLGCLLAARPTWRGEGSRVWVHDVDTGEWMDAREAVFVRQDAATTPMGSGLVAVATREQATRRSEAVYDFEELVSGDHAPSDEYLVTNDENYEEENGI